MNGRGLWSAAFLQSVLSSMGTGSAWDGMKYKLFQAQEDLLAPSRFAADIAGTAFSYAPPWMRQLPPFGHMAAGLEMLSRASLTHERPDYGFRSVRIGAEDIPITEEVVTGTAFGNLVRFKKAKDIQQPRLLLVAPLSGHFATLLRGTIETLLPDNDVYITDWLNARDAPLSAGTFGFDEYVEHVIAFLETMGPGAHIMGVCQPCAHALAAVAIMAEDDNPCTPLTMTLMAGPVDTRINPTAVNDLAVSRPIEWFEKELIEVVPRRFEGAGRRVYPGFIQLTAFVLMNMGRHVDAHVDMYTDLAVGRMKEAEKSKAFYDEYFAVLDLPAEFYLETVSRVFQQHLLPKGELIWRNRRVNPAAIRKTALFTVEGERDDICSVGQTVAAHDLCTSIYANRKRHHLQPGVGHYGVFSGSKWTNQIYPLVRQMIQSLD
jgi:poly(3-hydroxybutyrate) depolymerase